MKALYKPFTLAALLASVCEAMVRGPSSSDQLDGYDFPIRVGTGELL